ncbi:hypothetical protein [Thermoflexus sp.]|nr:hypothetical protein [Thermoflexus sp.]MCS7351527.1 hypothetical protein [Thermoflexus sp.]MCX7690847.1 hypothetical protein [Thermoflexus sp.]MDW8180985.1 hypothetical protein [Anaerolineae bacterium]
MKTRGLALATWLMAHPHALRIALMALWLAGAVFRLATPPGGGGSPT